ncbi:MAG: glycoside hydrolase family 43 protein [Chitinophagaceae bacterium]
MPKSFAFLLNQFIFFILIFISKIGVAQSFENEFKPGSIWLDNNGIPINAHGGGILYHKNIYYWFGEHKIEGVNGAKAMVGVHVYSSKNLYNWKDEGIALAVTEDTNSILQKGCIIERPKVIYNKKTKKFVMWFHHELKNQGYKAALTGVAVSDRVTGPFKYINSFRIHPKVWAKNFTKSQQDSVYNRINKGEKNLKQQDVDGAIMVRDFENGQMSRDMTLFVDDDQTAYHITASEENQTLLISKLSDDYLSLTTDYVRVFPGKKNEAPAIFKKDGTYFMFSSYTTGWRPNPGRLSKSNNMMEGWVALENPCKGTEEEMKTTFQSQSTFVIPLKGKKDGFIYLGDRWNEKNLGDSRYVWLPIQFENGIPFIEWLSSWNLSFFDVKKSQTEK